MDAIAAESALRTLSERIVVTPDRERYRVSDRERQGETESDRERGGGGGGGGEREGETAAPTVSFRKA